MIKKFAFRVILLFTIFSGCVSHTHGGWLLEEQREGASLKEYREALQKATYLFNVQAAEKEALNQQKISEPLRKEFKKHKISLSKSTIVKVVRPDEEWEITDNAIKWVIKRENQTLNVCKSAIFCHQYREKGYCRLNIEAPMLSREGMEYLKENLKKRMAELLKDKKLFKEIEWVELSPATKGFFLDISLGIENVDRARGREKWYDKPLAFLLYIPLGGWLSGFYHDEFYSMTLNKLKITIEESKSKKKLVEAKIPLPPDKVLILTGPINFHERTRGFYQYLLFFVPVLPPIWGPWDREEVILNLSYKLFVDFLNQQFLPKLARIGFNHNPILPVVQGPFQFTLIPGNRVKIKPNKNVNKIWVIGSKGVTPLNKPFEVPFVDHLVLEYTLKGDPNIKSITVDLRPLKSRGASSQGCQAYIKKDKPGKGNNP